MKTLISKRWTINLPEHRHDALDWDNWEKERLDALHKNIRKGDILYDIGAEQGDLTCLFALWGAKIIAVEPNPLFWPTIKNIFNINGIERPLNFFAGFASNKNNTPTDLLESPFTIPSRDGWPGCAWGDLIPNYDFRNVLERNHDTPQTTIDRLAREAKSGSEPSILNLDVEGSEFEVLKGAEQTLRKIKPLVFVSVHPQFMQNDYGYTHYDMTFWMENLGYEWEVLAIDHETHVAFWHPDGKTYIR